ncbi:sucrose-6-phosphate hydrolase [Erwinia sp.]|uniref:sucrose-6-phosphate hydrolase n=1 Tax=Erwinia citreus TaxID=558 RepID=UPI00289F5606|nr:sucrose-6-phosphate hydrolase [Erwinia sp.]
MSEAKLINRALKAVMNRQTGDDPYRPAWHLSPQTGLMNDPNGFIQFQGEWHLFYQWNPLACAHGAKYWGHWRSTNLIDWQHEPLALAPAEEYESHGCYSGSAVDHNGTLTLFYTGNVKFAQGRTAWQCLATVDRSGDVTKAGPVISLPTGYTGHVRDPKVWRHQNRWYMVLGAQNLAEQGKVLLYSSDSLHEWALLGEIAGSHLNGLGDFGYMWECPDLFALGDKDVLLVCPQGLPAQEKKWLNAHQSGYFIGSLDYAAAHFPHGEFHELDLGFEFYAPQTTAGDDGRRLLFGWMGVPDAEELLQPTTAKGWIHIMTCPRELTLEQGRLMQRPARELQQLRQQRVCYQQTAASLPALPVEHAELVVQSTGRWSACFGEALTLVCDESGLTLSRRNLRSGEAEYRYWTGDVSRLQILCDRSSIEIFINDGEGVMSARYFPQATPKVVWQGEASLSVDYWQLRSGMVV